MCARFAVACAGVRNASLASAHATKVWPMSAHSGLAARAGAIAALASAASSSCATCRRRSGAASSRGAKQKRTHGSQIAVATTSATRAQPIERLAPVGRARDFVTAQLENIPDRVANVGVVIDDHDACFVLHE